MLWWHAAAACLLALATGFASGWRVHGWKVGAEDAERLVDDIRLGRIAQERSTENANGLRKDLERLRARSAAGDAQLARMRVANDELAAQLPGGGLDPDGERLAACGRILEEGGGLVEAGRRLSSELAAKTARLQSQVGIMCVTPPEAE